MKLKVGNPLEVPAGIVTSAGATPYIAAKHVDPNYDPLVLWSLKQSPVEIEAGKYNISGLATKELSSVIDTLVLAGIETMEVVRHDKDLWEINYYE